VLFTFHEPIASVLGAPQPPLGPVRGGTVLLLDDVPTQGASWPACRFGDVAPSAWDAATGAYPETAAAIVVNATVVGSPASSRTLACTSPPFAAGGRTVPIALSLNAQQWTPTTSRFRIVNPPRVDAVLPDISPNTGGLVIELSGVHLEDGSDYRCRFARRKSVPASYDPRSASVLCVSPPGLLGYVSVSVTLNGQQYSDQEQDERRALITYYDADSADSLPA